MNAWIARRSRRRVVSLGIGILGGALAQLSCGGETRTFGNLDDQDGGPGGTQATGGLGAGAAQITGGAPSAGGTAGSGNTAGTPPTGGASTTGGAGGSGGALPDAGGGECVFVSAEDCFNGIDDDCNGLTDAADPACASSTECVPAAAGFTMGILLDADEACPAAYAAAPLDLNRALDAGGGCTGCSCTATVQCSTKVYRYATATDCNNDGDLTGGTYIGDIGPVNMCLSATPLLQSGQAFRVEPYETHNGPCVAQGSPTLEDPSWGASRRFCGTNLVGAGCGPGNVAVPVTGERRCVVQLGSQSCPVGYLPEQNPWYLDYDDQRGCGPCGCGTQTSGDCTQTTTGNPIQTYLYFGEGTSCSSGVHASAGSGEKRCTVNSTCNSMGFSSSSPLPPSCPGISQMSGSLTPTGEYTVCCTL
jgi:hypothetical protein